MGDTLIEIDIFESELVPKHILLTEQQKQELLERLKIKINQIPRIKEDDPAVKKINAKKLDIVCIVRHSETAGESLYYRVVV